MKRHSWRFWLQTVSKIYRYIAVLIGLVLVGCGTTGSGHYGAPISEQQPRNINNACLILQEKPHWAPPLVKTSQVHNTSVATMLAIIYQESSFKSRARPQISPVTKKPISSAYGYAQALDNTWKHYQQQTNKNHHRRDVFSHAVDFIGWYTSVTYKKNKVPSHRADLLYLNYHEGWGGYAKRTHLKKPWLLQTAKKVQARKHRFEKQLNNCDVALQNEGNGFFRTPKAVAKDMFLQATRHYAKGWF